MSRYKAFSDGQQWTILDTDGDGKPLGSALGTFTDQKQADARISEMLADNGVHLGILNHQMSGFKLIQDGKLWVSWYSNAAQDLQDEYFPRKATDGFISRVDRGIIPKPELWWFHMRGAKHGDALLLGRIGLLTLGVGKFDDSPIAEKFKSYYRSHKQENSHGFVYDPAQFIDGAYNYYNTFEISTLPPGHAANPFTVFEVFDMFDETKLKALAEIVGDADAELITTRTAETSKQLKSLGAKFKAFGDAEPDADDKGKEKKPAAAATDEKAIDVRIGTIEASIENGFKTFAKQLEQVFTPLAETLTAHKSATDALTTKLNTLESNFKALATFIRDEYAMQAPATQAQSTVPAPSYPGMQFMNMLQNQDQQAQQGQKGATSPLGLFGEVFSAIGVGNKSVQASPFEVPGAFGTPQVPTQQPAAQQQQPQQPLQFPQQNGGGAQQQQGGNAFANMLLGNAPANNQLNQQPGVGIPRFGQ